jgi:hypothetical protein
MIYESYACYFMTVVTHNLTPWSSVSLEGLIITTHLVKTFPVLWSPKVCYRIHGSSPQLLILNHVSSPSHHISLRSILILSSYLRLRLRSGLFPSGLPTKGLFAFVISHMRATWLVNLILLDLITLIIFGETYDI